MSSFCLCSFRVARRVGQTHDLTWASISFGFTQQISTLFITKSECSWYFAHKSVQAGDFNIDLLNFPCHFLLRTLYKWYHRIPACRKVRNLLSNTSMQHNNWSHLSTLSNHISLLGIFDSYFSDHQGILFSVKGFFIIPQQHYHNVSYIKH